MVNEMKRVLVDISGRACGFYSVELAKALAQNGCETYAVVPQDSLNLQEWLEEPTLKEVYVLKTYTNMKNIIPTTLKFELIDKGKIKKHFKGIEFDYVFKPFFHIWADGIAAQVSKKKLVTIDHDVIRHSGTMKIQRILDDFFVRNSDDIIVHTKSFIPIVCQNYGFAKEKVHYMPHGLLKMYRKKQNKTLPCLYDSKNVNFVFFGRIEKYKGIGVLLEAFAKLKKKYANVTLTIAGKGNMKEFETIAQGVDGIQLHNHYIPDEEVGCYFDGPNVVTMLPYLDATQSGVIPIAMEYGSPIIASDTGGLKEQMLDGAFGIYAEAGNADSLAEKMAYLIENPEEFEKQRKIMQQAMLQLEWKEVVANLLKELEQEKN